MGCCGSAHCTCKKERNIKWTIYAVVVIVVGAWMWYQSQESVQLKQSQKRPAAVSATPVPRP